MRKAAGIVLLIAVFAVTAAVFVLRNLYGPMGNQFDAELPQQLLLYGRAAGILAALIFLFQVLSNGRKRTLAKFIPPASLGKWHRWLGIGVAGLIAIHLGLIFAGRSMEYEEDWTTSAADFLFRSGWGRVTFAGLIVLAAVVVCSILFLRRTLKFPVWKKTHYFAYAAILLFFGHQIFCGFDFSQSAAFRWYWIALLALVLADAVVWKIRLARENA